MRAIMDQNDHAWGGWSKLVTLIVYIGCLTAFIADVTVEVFYVPFGIFYIPLVCTAVFHRDPRSAWWLGTAATFMIVVGFFLPIVAPNPTHALINRLASIGAIFVTATLIRHARGVQEQLAQQTKRAEAAERVKTEVFTALSQEMRGPLQSVVGLSELIIGSCRPDQRMPLAQVQSSSKRLLAAMENLIDLTNIEDRELTAETIDVNRVVTDAAAASRASAAERQISVELEFASTALTARGDPWAVRRILDNLIANAVKFSPAGGFIEIAAEHRPGEVSLLVRDTGIGMPTEVMNRLGQPTELNDLIPQLTGSGTGLALCRRLAQATGAELAFDSEIGCGTTAILRLPA